MTSQFIELMPECFERTIDLCSSSRRLIKLAFNLFNGFPADVFESFYGLDENNFNIALEAIQIRFGYLKV